MTNANLFQYLIDVLVILAVTWCICNRYKVIKFERNVWAVVKAFFLASRDVIMDTQNKKKSVSENNVIKVESYDLYSISENSDNEFEIGVA